MKIFSTSQAAKKLGLQVGTLARYIAVGKLPAPTILKVGTASLHAWTEEEIEHVRKILPKIANGRKTRYQKLREKQKAQAGVPVPHKKRKPTKKK
jgi:predicted DNA-binding transcriptional regulator AlpA